MKLAVAYSAFFGVVISAKAESATQFLLGCDIRPDPLVFAECSRGGTIQMNAINAAGRPDPVEA